MSVMYSCSHCPTRSCARGGEQPANCPMRLESDLIQDTIAWNKGDTDSVALLTAAAESPKTPAGVTRNRVEEIIAFSQRMGWRRLGVAFCIMFAKEARVLCDQLAHAGFEVVRVCCKVGAVGLPELGVPICDGKAACNPVTQAALLNTNATELNIALGLCLGHDLLFAKHAEGPVTTLAVKDRALRHQPLDALRPVAGEGRV